MKKTTFLLLTAATLFCACQKENSRIADVTEVEFTIGADIEANKTAFVPDSKKVYWTTGDKMGLKYTKTAETIGKYDNIALTLDSGAGTCSGTFKGKLSSTSAIPDGAVLVFYYPQVSTVAKSGSVTDKDNFVLGGNFPKVQNTNDVAFDPNLMYGFVTDVPAGWPTTDEAVSPLAVSMKNVMSVIDFTLKGAGSVKRLFVTDLNASAPAMTGDYTVNVTNGEFAGFASLPSGVKECDRTIIADFTTPIVLSPDSSHVYVTVMPRTYSKGIMVGLELTDGDYMTAKISQSFETKSNEVYVAPELTFSSQKETGKGIYENTIYTYKTFTDSRDGQLYRYVTMADGNDWMIDNLRYLPEGYTPSSDVNEADNGVWYPVVLNATGTGLQFSTDAKDIAKFGYIYNPAVAYDQDAAAIRDILVAMDIDKTMTAAEALTELRSWDNAGICPEGWHIPTADEYSAMAKEYVTALTDVSLMSLLGQQGFSLKDFGYMMVAAPTAAKPDPSGTLQTFTSGKLNSTYLLLSTPTPGTGAKINDWNKGFQAVMTNVSNNTANTANMLARSGAAVRCIRAAK